MADKVYPRWVFNPDALDRIVNTPEEEAALGEGWYDTPADFPQGSAATAAEQCPYCKVYQARITELENQIVDLEKAKE